MSPGPGVLTLKAGVGLASLLVVLSTSAIVLGSVGQVFLVSPAGTRAPSSSVVHGPAPDSQVLSVTEGRDSSEIKLILAAPFTEAQAERIAERLGVDVVASYPAFGTYLLRAPQILVDPGPGSDGATLYFPKLMTWGQARSYLAANDLTLVRGFRDRETGEWIAQVRLPSIEVTSVDPYAGLWR